MRNLTITSLILVIMISSMIGPFAGSIALAQQQQAPLFTIYTLVPDTPPTRLVWVGIIENQWKSIGINTQLAVLPFNDVLGRIRLLPREKWGATFQEGGYDLTYNRYGIGGIVNPRPFWSCDAKPPLGYFYWCDRTADNLLSTYEQSRDPAVATKAIQDWQKYLWNDVSPNIPIFNNDIVDLISPKVQGLDSPFYVYLSFAWPDRLTIVDAPKPVTYVIADNNVPASFSPFFDVSAWKNYYGPAFDQLETINNWKEKKPIPSLATDWTQSADGKTIVINLRQGVKWHDGWEFNATDVKFTWDMIMNPKAATSDYYGVRPNLQNATWETTGKYQITLRYSNYNKFWESLLYMGQSIAPWHVLKDIPLEQLKSHPFATGIGSYEVKKPDGTTYVAHGPIGTGPFIFDSFDPVGVVVTMTKNPNYWRPVQGNIDVYKAKNIRTPDAAIAALKAGEVTHVYNLFQVENWASAAAQEGWGKAANFSNILTWEVQLNHKHPVFGTGVDTPLGKREPARALEAARYVRLAMSYAIPRQAIVDQFGLGFGKIAKGPIPPAFPESIFDQQPAHDFSLSKAREYLRMAGYNVPEPGQPASASLPLSTTMIAAVLAVVAVIGVVYFAKVRKPRSKNKT